jgi:queuine tRNA-ribosyltransferase
MRNLFNLIKTSSDSRARAGVLNLNGIEVETPVFMPVGTLGSVKAVEHRNLIETDFKIILGNTYHLYLRPGNEVMNHFGGLHKFINWDRAILTDSGGYQVFSLSDLRKITEEGVKFQSHIDGSYHFFSPENVIETQRILGSDIVMVLDECTPYPSEYKYAKDSMDLSLKWAQKSRDAFDNTFARWGREQFLFGIGQGSMYRDLRKSYVQQMVDIGFDGYAIGGLSVGEPAEVMYEMVDVCTSEIPDESPRYLMGVGTPENILEAIELGIDMFDCVLPTRNARNGQLFTSKGKINIKNAKYKFSNDCIDENINAYASNDFTLGYLRHLYISGEILALQLGSQHNLAFYKWLVVTAREKILTDEYRQWKLEILNAMNQEII